MNLIIRYLGWSNLTYLGPRLAQVFFGTPHQGTAEDQWDQIAQGYALRDKALGKRSALVDTMRLGSDILADVTSKFRQIADEYNITSFYERRPWKGTNACIVNETAAQMVTEREIARPVDADHIAMCRFGSAGNSDFRSLCLDIEEATGIEPNFPDEDETEIGEEDVPADRLATAEAARPASFFRRSFATALGS